MPGGGGLRSFRGNTGSQHALEYFDAHLIGLTATPNKQAFGCFLWDICNFNAGSRFENLEDLAKAGMAADFLMTGASKAEVISTTITSVRPGSLAARAS